MIDKAKLYTLFAKAMDIESEAERQAFVDRECEKDEPLRHQLEKLLKTDREPDGFLEKPALLFLTTIGTFGREFPS